MGLEFKLSDRELPVSPIFVHFLSRILKRLPFDREVWADQRSEGLLSTEADLKHVAEAAALVMGSAFGRERLTRAYTLLFALLTGDLAPLIELQSRFQFVTCIGIPRTGGSYLTAELFRALRMVPEGVPSGLAHDSFPEVGPFQLQQGVNSWVVCLKTVAEYFTMVEVFFGEQRLHDGKIVVPKKLTKAIYAGGLFHQVLGAGTVHMITVRHPVASCVSTYEKSGGLPEDGYFAVRSNIEDWCRRDLAQTGCSDAQLKSMDYFDAYLRYWEHYYVSLAMTGLAASRHLNVIAFSQSALQLVAQSYHGLYGSGLQASPFHTSDAARRRHPRWIERARPALERVGAVWRSVGIPFPRQEIDLCW